MKREDLLFALSETTHALRFTESAAKCFTVDADEVEAAVETATSLVFIQNRLFDAKSDLSRAANEIRAFLERTS